MADQGLGERESTQLEIMAGKVQESVEYEPGKKSLIYSPFNIQYTPEFLGRVNRKGVYDCLAADLEKILTDQETKNPKPVDVRITVLHELYGLLKLSEIEADISYAGKEIGPSINGLLKENQMEPIGGIYPGFWLTVEGFEKFVRYRPDGSFFERAKPFVDSYANAIKQFLKEPNMDNLDSVVHCKTAISSGMQMIYRDKEINPLDYIHTRTISSFM